MSAIKSANRSKPCPIEDADASEIKSADALPAADQENEEEEGGEEVPEEARGDAQDEVQGVTQQEDATVDVREEASDEAQEEAQELHEVPCTGDADEPMEGAVAECEVDTHGQEGAEDAAIQEENEDGDVATGVAQDEDADAPAEDDANAGGNADDEASMHGVENEDEGEERMWDPTEPEVHVQAPVAIPPAAKAKSRPPSKAGATRSASATAATRPAKQAAPKKKRKGAPGARKRVRAIHSDSEPEPSDGEDIGDGMNDYADAEDDIELDPEEARKMAEFIAPESEEEEVDDAETEAGDPLRAESDDEEVERIAQATKARYAKMVAQEKSTLAAQAARKAAAAARIDQTRECRALLVPASSLGARVLARVCSEGIHREAKGSDACCQRARQDQVRSRSGRRRRGRRGRGSRSPQVKEGSCGDDSECTKGYATVSQCASLG